MDKNTMNQTQQPLETLKHKPKGKANAVFLKLYARLHKPKKTFDEAKRFNPPSGNINASL